MPIAALLVLILGACARYGSAPRFNGSYLPDAKLLLDPDPQAYRPSRLERGEHWIVWLSAHQGGQGPLSESARRADLFIELSAPPTLGQPVDLEREPIQVSYEAGGQAITYIARSARGVLLLSAREGTTLIGHLDVTLHSPMLGEGEQRINEDIRLQERRDFVLPPQKGAGLGARAIDDETGG
jgi:hypothetical protein